MKFHHLTRLSVAVAASVILASVTVTAVAQEQQVSLGTFSDWTAFTFLENGNKVCYVLSRPIEARHGGRPRGEIFALVTHRPYQNVYNVVSFIAGYTFKPGSEVTVQIGGDKFELFTEGDGAWARDEATDRKIVKELRDGLRMIVKGVSSRGTQTTDTYSLRGTSASLDTVNGACNVSGEHLVK